jgi:arylsulfatase A-like enzyme
MPLHRRQFLFGTLALPAFAATKNPKNKIVERPNIVCIEAQDLGAYMLGCYGNSEVRTPHIDRLAQIGVRFSNNFAAAPVSSAGREPLETSPTLLKGGYHQVSAEDFLKGPPPPQPFLLTISWPSPLAQAAPQSKLDLYTSVNFETIGREAATAGQMATLRKYAAGLTTLDEQLPALQAKLEQGGLSDKTALIFTSSNGYLLGQHGLWGDGLASDPVNMFEEVVRVPLIFACPALFPPQTNPTEIVSVWNLWPTLCDLGGEGPGGASYLPFVYGHRLPKKQSWPGVAFARFRNAQMARDDRYKVVLYDQPKGPNQFFDISVDPHEQVNQYDNPQYSSARDHLTAELAAWRRPPQ